MAFAFPCSAEFITFSTPFDGFPNRSSIPHLSPKVNDIVRYRDSITEVEIAASVTSIGRYGFQWLLNVTSITIPGTVTSIGSGAFYQCYELTNVTLNSGVVSLSGEHIFGGCDKLKSITIPDSVTNINALAFGASSLEEINVDNNNLYYCSVDGILFNKAASALLGYPRLKSGTSYTIPNGVTTIGEHAFNETTGLTTITIPNGVTSIGDHAFYIFGDIDLQITIRSVIV